METWRSMYLYEIRNTVNNSVYVGITRSSVAARWRCHKSAAKRGVKSILYDAIRSIGFDNFYIVCVCELPNEESLLSSEKELIALHRKSDHKCYNILDGGEPYFPITDWDAQKEKLKKARAGRKPALGMKHTDENKAKFSNFGKQRWDLCGRYPEEVLLYRFIESNRMFGISKTHYYRLRKLAESNDLS
jgi:group I intron endonuclease